MGRSAYLAGIREKLGPDLLLMPAVSAIVVDVRGRVLLQQGVETGSWGTLGGVLEPGETPAAAAIREVREETSLEVVVDRLVGVYVTPEVMYRNGDRAMYVVTAFRCRPVAGEARVNDDESLDIRYFAPVELPALRPDQALRVAHALDSDAPPFFEL